MHDRSLSLVVTCTSITCSGFKLELWTQTSPLWEMMQSCNWFPHVSKMPTLTHSQESNVSTNNNSIWSEIHTIFNLYIGIKKMLHTAIKRHITKTIVDFDAQSKCQNYLLSYVREWGNTLEQSFNILWRCWWTITTEDYKKPQGWLRMVIRREYKKG